MYDSPNAVRRIETAEEASTAGESGNDKGCIKIFLKLWRDLMSSSIFWIIKTI